MKDIFQAFDDRALYLHCRKHSAFRSSAAKRGTGDKAGKVVFTSDGQSTAAPQTTVTLTTLKANKTQQEDAAVTLIKNILSSQKMKAQGQGDGEKEPPSSSGE